MTTKVTGGREGVRAFRAFPVAARAEIEAALQKSAEEILARAKAIAPSDTGELRGALEIRDSLDGFAATGAVGDFARSGGVGKPGTFDRSSPGVLARYIGVFPNVKGAPGWYAAFVEFGTAARTAGARYAQRSGKTRKSKDTHPGTPARPFLKPAFFSLKGRALNRIRRAVSAAAKTVAALRRAA